MKIITETQKRVSEDSTKVVLLPLQFITDYEQYQWMYSYSVQSDDKPEAMGLSQELYEMLMGGVEMDDLACQRVIKELYDLRVRHWNELDKDEVWDQVASRMPEDIGGLHKNTIMYLMSSIHRGTILESMCGFNSYLLPHVDRNVIAMDYSEKMLKKYEYPERMRVQFDLNELPNSRIEFPDNYFDSIMFVKGYKYLEKPQKVLKEYLRILKPGGLLSFVESQYAMYSELAVRDLCVKTTKEDVEQAGFVYCDVRRLPFSESPDDSYYLFSTIKN